MQARSRVLATALFFGVFLADGGPVWALEQVPSSPPMGGPTEARRRQIQRELSELQQNQLRQFAIYQGRLNDVRRAQQEAEAARARLKEVRRRVGRANPEAESALSEVNRLQQNLYATISAREHARYQLEILNKGIQDRKFSLQLRQADAR